MADYYTLFSFVIPNLTDEEKAYIESLTPDDIPNESGGCDFQIDGRGDLWMHDGGGYGSADDVAEFVQQFLSRFRPKSAVGFRWAGSCSKPRLDAYGGGVLLVTADGIEGTCGDEWLDDKEREAQERGLKIEATGRW